MRRPLTLPVFVLIWLSAGSWLRAQPNTLPLEFTHIQEQQGLSHNLMGAMLRDRNGFLWLGTIDGLNRFDGTHFTVFKSGLTGKQSITNNRVHSLCEDKRGYIWIGTRRGINWFNPETQQITRIDSVNGKRLSVCYSIVCDRRGDVWFSDGNAGLVCYRVKTGRFDIHPVSSADPKQLTADITRNGLLEDPYRDGLWMTTAEGLNYLDTRTNIVYSYRNNPEGLPVFTRHSTSALAMDGTAQLLFSDNEAKQLVVVDLKTRRSLAPIQLTGTRNREAFPVGTVFIDRNHNLWVSSWSFTLFFIEGRTRRVTEFFHDESVKTSVAANFFWDAWQHPDGSIWLATMNGLSITNPERTFYTIYDLKRFDPTINDYFGISSMAADGDTWWLTTPKYLMRFNRITNQFERYLLPVQEENNYTPNLPQVICDPVRKRLFIRFWKQIFTFDIVRKTFSPVPVPDNLPQSTGEIWYSYLDVQGHYLWVYGTFMLGLRYDLQNDTWEKFPVPKPAANFHVTWAAVDRRGTYWLNGFPNGFYRLNPDKKRFELHTRAALPDYYKRARSFLIDPHNTFWMPVDGSGLAQYIPASDTFRLYGVREGVDPNSYGMGSIDSAGQVWVPFYNRFRVFSPSKKQARSFTLQINEGEFQYANNLIRLRSGTILASLKGYLVEFMPGRYGKPMPAPQVLINSVSPPDTSYLVSNRATEMSLSVDENTFTIDYSVVTPQPAHKYRFKLDGYDDGWREAGSKTIAGYTKIPGGTYTFRVKAIDGDTETAEATLTVVVDTEFYKKNWFRVLMLFIVAGLTLVFLRYRTQQTAKLHHLQMQATRLERDKTDIQYQNLINHLNPHFLFNSLTSLNSLIVTNPRQASRFLQKLSAIYRYILQNKEKETVSVEHELNFVRHYIDLQLSRFEDGLDITLDVPDEYLMRGVVPVTLQNLLENAIKHNTIEDEKPLHIRVYADGDYLCVENSLQKKHFVETSNKQGLDSLKTLYGYLSDKPVRIVDGPDTFTVMVPFL